MNRESINKKFNVTEEQLEQEAQEYEKGTWDGRLGKIIMGRPSIADEEVKPVTFRLPLSKIQELDRKASQKGYTRSEGLREAVEEYLSA